MPIADHFVKSLYSNNASTYNCTFNVTNNDSNWSANNPNAAFCSDAWNSTVWVLVVTLVPLFAVPFVALVVTMMIHTTRRRKSRHDTESIRGDESQEGEEPKSTLKEFSFGGSTEFSESATKVSEDDKEDDKEADEDDISSHTHSSPPFYQHSQERTVMQFFKMGLFRTTSSSAESQRSSPPGLMPSGAREPSRPPIPGLASGAHGFCDSHANAVPDYDPYNHIASDGTGMLYPPTTAFHACPPRPRSFSESTIIAPTKPSQQSPTITPPLPASLPSSPPINAGTYYESSHSTFSLSLSEKLEGLNKQIQRKTSSSSLKSSETGSDRRTISTASLKEFGVGAFEMGRDGGNRSKRGGFGHFRSESSMDFKCRGLPESGTFSKLTDAETAMRTADELATKQRSSRVTY